MVVPLCCSTAGSRPYGGAASASPSFQPLEAAITAVRPLQVSPLEAALTAVRS